MVSLMFTDPQLHIMGRAIKEWGPIQQTIKAVEEMSELQKALCKWLNMGVSVRNGALTQEQVNAAIQDELVDVSIMLYQLRQIFPDGDFFKRVDAKLARLNTYLPPQSYEEPGAGG